MGRARRRRHVRYWRVVNPLGRRLAGELPWWIVLETTGRRTGLPRRTPLAIGPTSEGAIWVVTVHGYNSDFVKNIHLNPRIRYKHKTQWRAGTASIEPMDADIFRRFSAYAKSGPKIFGMDPTLVRIVPE
jgi:deazaflavin-dependent oxidoreductase (nitroreductase family)